MDSGSATYLLSDLVEVSYNIYTLIPRATLKKAIKRDIVKCTIDKFKLNTKNVYLTQNTSEKEEIEKQIPKE